MTRRLINGLTVVVFGAILLMNTTGYLPWTVWDAALEYWPLIIIGLGLQVVFAKQRVPGVAIAFLIILILAAMNPYPRSRNIRWPGWISQWSFISGPSKKTTTWRLPLEAGMSFLDLDLTAPSVNIEIRGDAGLSKGEAQALEASLGWDQVKPEFSVRFDPDNGRMAASIAAEGSGSSSGIDRGRQDWAMRLNPSLSTTVKVTGGVANVTLDALSLALEELTVDAGVSKLNLAFGLSEGTTTVTVGGGVSDIGLTASDAVGIRVTVANPVFNAADLTEEGLMRTGNTWVTQNYDAASAKLNVNITCGTGKINLKRLNLGLSDNHDPSAAFQVISGLFRGYYPGLSTGKGWRSTYYACRNTTMPELLLSFAVVPDVHKRAWSFMD